MSTLWEKSTGILRLHQQSESTLTMKIEDKETSIWKVAVKLQQDLIGGTVRCFQGCVSTENSQLRWILIGTVPRKEKGSHLKRKLLVTASINNHFLLTVGLHLGERRWSDPRIHLRSLVFKPEARAHLFLSQLTFSEAFLRPGHIYSSEGNTIYQLLPKCPHFKV